MFKFTWYDRVPKLHDHVPHASIPPEEDDELSAPERETDGLADLFIYIDYINAGGISRRRPITVRKEGVSGGNPCLFAYCHVRRAFRQFRLDRINSVITADGEIYQPASKFWQHIGFHTGSVVSAQPPIPDDRYAATSVKRKFNHELVVLAALSGSDGNMHDRELDQIVDYIERELEWDRIAMQPNETVALRNHLKRMRITQDRLIESVEELLKNQGKFRLYARQLDRFLNTAQQVVTADGVLHPAEMEFIDFLGATLRG